MRVLCASCSIAKPPRGFADATLAKTVCTVCAEARRQQKQSMTYLDHGLVQRYVVVVSFFSI
jgi:hypothetical protein